MTDLSHIYFAGEEPTDELWAAARLDRGGVAGERACNGPEDKATASIAPGAALSPFLNFVLNESGLGACGYQPKALNRRFAACLRVLRATSEQTAINALQQKPELAGVLLNTLLIGVSEFFRDQAVFEHLRQGVLPQALAKGGQFRVYSAGCSAGQELYSVAMVLDELGGLESSRLVGVDCRREAIEQARAGRFPVVDLKNIGQERRQRHFGTDGRHAVISARLKEQIDWRVADFGLFRVPEPCDLILFRNVAIYLDLAYATRTWHWLDRQLKPGGVIVTGQAERPPQDLCWNREAPCVYRKL